MLSSIERNLSEKVSEQKLEALSYSDNVDSKTIDQVKQIIESGGNISLSTMKWGQDGSISETSTIVASIVGGLFTILIYMFIMIYGSMVMQAVMEEKAVVEVMISSVKPFICSWKIAGIDYNYSLVSGKIDGHIIWASAFLINQTSNRNC